MSLFPFSASTSRSRQMRRSQNRSCAGRSEAYKEGESETYVSSRTKKQGSKRQIIDKHDLTMHMEKTSRSQNKTLPMKERTGKYPRFAATYNIKERKRDKVQAYSRSGCKPSELAETDIRSKYQVLKIHNKKTDIRCFRFRDRSSREEACAVPRRRHGSFPQERHVGRASPYSIRRRVGRQNCRCQYNKKQNKRCRINEFLHI